jgi:hypothetical protein
MVVERLKVRTVLDFPGTASDNTLRQVQGRPASRVYRHLERTNRLSNDAT